MYTVYVVLYTYISELIFLTAWTIKLKWFSAKLVSAIQPEQNLQNTVKSRNSNSAFGAVYLESLYYKKAFNMSLLYKIHTVQHVIQYIQYSNLARTVHGKWIGAFVVLTYQKNGGPCFCQPGSYHASLRGSVIMGFQQF